MHPSDASHFSRQSFGSVSSNAPIRVPTTSPGTKQVCNNVLDQVYSINRRFFPSDQKSEAKNEEKIGSTIIISKVVVTSALAAATKRARAMANFPNPTIFAN